MPTVRLEFELDSEVYPELHAALSALSSASARSERMRQLAAGGLVWEKVRIHGAAVMTRTELPPAPPGTLVQAPPVLPKVERRAAPAKRPRPAPVQKRRASDFVDLAISAEPEAAQPDPTEHPGAGLSRQEVEQVLRELPVLNDVVIDMPDLADHAADETADDDATDLPDAALHVTALSQKPETKSRLKRMKERGLFKNG